MKKLGEFMVLAVSSFVAATCYVLVWDETSLAYDEKSDGFTNYVKQPPPADPSSAEIEGGDEAIREMISFEAFERAMDNVRIASRERMKLIEAKAKAGDPAADEKNLVFQEAERRTSVPAKVLFRIFEVESDRGNYLGKFTFKDVPETEQKAIIEICRRLGKKPNDVACSKEGAVGPMQFLASIWLEYGQDGNHDGVANPWDLLDAVPSSAYFLLDHDWDHAPRQALACYVSGGAMCPEAERYIKAILTQ